MKTMVFGIFVMFFSISAVASESYKCSANLPQGKAYLAMRTQTDGSQIIKFAFANQARNQTYVGTLQVVENTSSGLLAEGNVLAYEANPQISVSLSGSLAPDDNGTVTLLLYAQGDERIEYGFGNILHCQKQ